MDEKLIKYLGGNSNVIKTTKRDGLHYFFIKDMGLVDLPKINEMIIVEYSEISRGKVIVSYRNTNEKENFSMSKDYTELANKIIELVGEKDNVTLFTHCVTRLRFNIKNRKLVDDETIKDLSGVIGVQWAGDQFQVIIGPDVEVVYDTVCRIGGFSKETVVNENIDEKKDLSVKGVLNTIVATIADCFVPVIPAIVVSSFIGLIPTILGPTMLDVMSAESDLYQLFTFVGNVGFYFLPMFMGMTAAKKFGVSQILGLFIGGILLHPTLLSIVGTGESFTVYGIPMTLVSYASSTIPVLLSVWIMSYIERFIKQYCPDSLKMIIVPTLTILIMLPIVLCIIGPLGTVIGNVLADIVISVASYGTIPRILVGTVVGGIFIFAIMAGMHIPLYMIALGVMSASGGSDNLIIPAMCTSVSALLGVEIGAALRAKKSENRALALSYIVTHAIGGVTEPAIFGIGIRYGKPLVCTSIGAACGSLFIMLSNAGVYTIVPSSNLLMVTSFAGSTTMNFVLGAVGLGIAVLVGAITTYFFGFKNIDY